MINWADQTKRAADILKKRYNGLLQRYNAMDDGTAEIVSNPVFKKLNDELIETAKELAELEGVKGSISDVQDHFKDGELVKGFQMESEVKSAA